MVMMIIRTLEKEEMKEMEKKDVLAFCCYSNKLPQTSWPDFLGLADFLAPSRLGQHQGVSWAVIALEASGENLSPRLFRLLEAACIPWLRLYMYI